MPATPARTAEQKRQRLKELLAEKCIIHNTEEEKIYGKNGSTLKWLADVRTAFLNAESLDLITDLFWEKFSTQRPLQVGGMEVGAIPLVTAILTKATALGYSDVNSFIIRKERKDSGRARIIEGELDESRVILVDDLINSASSFEKCRVVLEREGKKVEQAFTVIDFENQRGMKWRAEKNIAVTSLYTLSDFGLSLNWAEPVSATWQNYVPSWRAGVKGANPFYVNPKSGPLLVEDKVCVGTDAGLFLAFDARTGEERWRFDTRTKATSHKGIFSTAVHHNGRLYFGAYNGNLYCLEAATGKQVWVQQLCEWIGSSPLIVGSHNLLYIGLEYARPRAEGSYAAFRLSDGARVWEVPTRTFLHGSGAYDGQHDTVIYGTNDHTVVASKAANGEKVWEVGVRGPVKYAPAVNEARGLVGVTSHDGSLYLFATKDGARVAEFPTDNICYSTPLFHGNRMFATSADRFVYVINLDTMQVEKKIDCYARLFATPVFVAPGTVAVATTQGRVMEIDLETLEISGRLTVPDTITNSPVVTPDGKMIIVPTYMNELYAFHRHFAMRTGPSVAIGTVEE